MIKYKKFKRLSDFVLSLLLTVIFTPIILLIIIITLLDDFGNPIYFGDRVGLKGKVFKIIKIRSMYINSEWQSGTTAKDDKRITSFGKIIRKIKFDELTNLINIIKGDMSFVGPRPEIKEYVDLYSAEEKKILTVRPGITDYASIKFISLDEIVGKNDAHDEYLKKVFKEKNQLRLKYVNNMNLQTDIFLLVQTIISLFKKFL
tara:strand:+ start:28589 stop:29197 length:609 start_codon:yes stop_codon:yes gene_type:complete